MWDTSENEHLELKEVNMPNFLLAAAQNTVF